MLFIVGYHASGKTHFANTLVEQYGALHIETSAVVRAFKSIDNPDAPMEEWAAAKEAEHGTHFFDDLIIDATRFAYLTELEKGITPQEVVITGNRSLTGITYAQEQLSKLQDRKSSIIAVEVSTPERYKRYKERDRRPGDADMSLEVFEELIVYERDTGLDDIFAHADYIMENDSTEKEFTRLEHELAMHELGLRQRSMDGEDTSIYGEGTSPGR